VSRISPRGSVPHVRPSAQRKQTIRRREQRKEWRHEGRRATLAELQRVWAAMRHRTTAVKHTCGCWIEWDVIVGGNTDPGRALALKLAASQWAHAVKHYPCPWHGSASGAPATARRDRSWVRIVRAPIPVKYREWPERGSLPTGYPFDFMVITDEQEGAHDDEQ
jgi:hypothetical protein